MKVSSDIWIHSAGVKLYNCRRSQTLNAARNNGNCNFVGKNKWTHTRHRKCFHGSLSSCQCRTVCWSPGKWKWLFLYTRRFRAWVCRGKKKTRSLRRIEVCQPDLWFGFTLSPHPCPSCLFSKSGSLLPHYTTCSHRRHALSLDYL